MNNTNQKLLLILSFCVLVSPILLSQSKVNSRIIRKSSYYKQYSEKEDKKIDTFQLGFEITSMSISIDKKDNFLNAYILAKNDTFFLTEDGHGDDSDSVVFSELIIFKEPIQSFIINKGSLKGLINYHFINSGKTPNVFNGNSNKKTNEACGKPQTIDQGEWRKGLTAPSYTPSYTSVKHLIVHHSAGSNANTDFTNVVRQIYLYHTEVRKYSDIAYNFLIAQDGTVYEGREGVGENEENVTGAHFCAKNSGTMGICLLGNYETATPTEQMLTSLKNLMAWKLVKENLNPFASSPHPPGADNTASLGVIAGHRDGCATECPGQNVYSRLNEIKQLSEEAKKNINAFIPSPLAVSKERTGPGKLTLEVSGGTEGNYLWSTSSNIRDTIPGEYGSKFITPYLSETTSFFVASRSGSCTSDFIQIYAIINDEELLIYPNPSEGEVTITFDKAFDPRYFSLTSSIGQRITSIRATIRERSLSFDVSKLSSGIYTVRVKSPSQTITRRLIVK